MYSRVNLLLTKCMQLQECKLEKENRRQQRLFTGALFPESVNDALWHFAQRHNLTSCVWVPLKLFDAILRKYNIYVLPTAALCDVTMTYGGNALEVAHAIGVDRIYVNAQHTSNTSFFEYFRECTTSILHTDASENDLSWNTFNEADKLGDTITYEKLTSTTSTAEEKAKQKFFSYNNNNYNNNIVNDKVSIEKTGNYIKRGGDDVCENRWNDYITAADPQERHKYLQKLIGKDEMRVFSLYNKRFCYPLTSTSAPLIDSHLVRRLLRIQEERKYKSNYWIKANLSMKSTEMKNVEETEFAGRYNPTWSVHYEPHTYTNLSFPSHTRRLMRQRAVEYGYVSRTWITLYEAEHVYKIKLKSERAHDAPYVYCNYFSIDNSAHAFYCADQFNSGGHSFPTAQEIDLASSGVQIETNKLSAFPLLRFIAMICKESQIKTKPTPTMTNTYELIENNAEYSERAISNNQSYEEEVNGTLCAINRADNTNSVFGTAKVTSFDANDRIGADTSMSDALRHIRFEQLTKRYDNLRLYGYTKRKHQENYLKSGFREVLRRQCILKGFPVPFFVNTRQIMHMGCAVRCGELGIPQTVLPLRLLDFNAWLDGECWFNVSQLQEPDVVMEMFFAPAVHFLTRERLTGRLLLRCCRQQVRQQYKSRFWLPHFILRLTGWAVKTEAIGIPYTPMAVSSNYKMFRVIDNVFFNMDDVLIIDAEREFLCKYQPMNERGEKFIRVLRMAMTLCALFYQYQSCIWVCYQVGNSGPFYERRSANTEERLHSINEAFTKSKLFEEHPFVTYRSYKFINSEELLNFDTNYIVNTCEKNNANINATNAKYNPSHNVKGEESKSLLQESDELQSYAMQNLNSANDDSKVLSHTATFETNVRKESVDDDEESLTSENWAVLFDSVQEKDEQNSSSAKWIEGNSQCEEGFESNSVSAQELLRERNPINCTNNNLHSTFNNKTDDIAVFHDDDNYHDNHSRLNKQNILGLSQNTQMEQFDYYGKSHFAGNEITDDEINILY